MNKKPSCLAASFCIFLSSMCAAQAMASYLPAAIAPKAAKLLAAIDEASAAIEARRAASWGDELKAEAEAVDSYARIAASRAGRGPWASPDGSARASDSATALSAARAKSAALARALASGEDGSAESVASREASAEALAKLITSSGIGAKAAASIEKSFSAKVRDLKLFPEIKLIADRLLNAGAAGAREAAAAMSRRSAESIALSLIASKTRIVSLAPGTEGDFLRLEADSRAYRAWIAAFPTAEYPGDIASASDVDKAVLAAALSAFIALKADRAASLVEIMASGDGRDAAAAAASQRLAGAWQRSPEPRRRDLAALCALPESTLASFCSIIGAGAKPAAPSVVADPIALMSALNGLEATIAEEEARVGASRGSEPSLILLEKPELAVAARGEARYASLFAEASRRLGAIYAQSSEDAASRLEASPTLATAAERALGANPASISVRAVDLSLPQEESGRRVAFIAAASDSSGSTQSLPLSAVMAGEVYAQAFAKASGIDASKINAALILARYGQCVVSAYDPEDCDDGLVVELFPKGGGPARLGILDLELALLGGWKP
jgi:hypothetical protein